MSTCKASVTYFGPNGKTVGIGGELYLPDYLDWMPIEVKAFWFTARGLGEPKATHLLLHSQGEQQLVQITTALRDIKLDELKEINNGLEERVREFQDRHGISRKPRNQ